MSLDLLQEHGLNPIRPDYVDASSLGDFIRCPSYYYLRYVLGLQKKRSEPGETSALDWGTCWHTTLEHYHRSGQDIQAALAALEANYPTDIHPSTDRFKRSKERMLQAFFDYVERFGDDDSRMDMLRHEQHFQIYSEELDLEWTGKIDSVRRENGLILPWDYKTTSSMGPSYFDQFEVSIQFPGYVWATQQITNESVDRIKLDVFYMISKSHDFFRRTFRYTPEDIAEWVRNVKLWKERLSYLLDNHLYEPEKWPKSWGMCAWWYGRKCPFFDVHTTSPQGDVRLAILSEDYVEERWDPREEAEDLIQITS